MSDVDLSQVGVSAAEIIDDLASDLEESFENVEVGTIGIIVELTYKNTEDDEDYTILRYRCSDPRKWVQFGLFQRIADNLRHEMDEA